jgi:tetratricopeptide (TPR) repeat protein
MNSTRAAECKTRADTFAEQGETELAIQAYRQALDLKDDYFEVHANLGNLLVDVDRIDAAISHYHKAAQLRPDIAELHDNLGNALRLGGDSVAALAAHDKALQLKPGLIEARINRGNALNDLGLQDEAVEEFTRVLNADPTIPEAHFNLAVALDFQGNMNAALEHYREALRLQPDLTAAVLGATEMLDRLGQPESARKQLQPFADRRSKDVFIAIAHAGLATNDNERRESIADLEGLLSDKKVGWNVRRRIYFRLGALYDAMQSFDRAFENYRQGNGLVRGEFDRAGKLQDIEKLIEAFNPQNFRSLPGATNVSDLPVFIVGLPRAGKTLAEEMLASHPQVTGAGELADVTNIMRAIEADTGKDFPLGIDKLPVGKLDEYANEYLAKRRAGAFQGATRVVDTMPGNFKYLGLIKMLFPRAHIIHCRRDPLDQCLECYFKNFFRAGEYAYTTSLDDLAFMYIHYSRLMRHWKETLALPLLEVRYEALVQQPEATCRELLDFAGLAWDPRCLDFHQLGKSQLMKAREIHEPVHTRFIDRWKNYEQHLRPLMDGLAPSLRET